MKKFAKILTVVLAVCMIVGIMAVSVSAAAPTKPSDGYGTVAANGGVDFADGGKCAGCYIKSITAPKGRFYNDGTVTHTHDGVCGSEPNARALLVGSIINKVKGTDYSTLDFTFGSDKYLVNGALTDTKSEGAMLAYTTHFALGIRLESNYILGNFVQDQAGNWYVSEDTSYSAEDAPLATEINAVNYATYLLTPSSSSLFVNGEHVKTINFGFVADDSGDTVVYTGNCAPGFYVSDQTVANATQFSIVGNPAGGSTGAGRPSVINYKDGYGSGDSTVGIDDYLWYKSYNMNLLTCQDTYYYNFVKDKSLTELNLANITYKDSEGNEIEGFSGYYSVPRATIMDMGVDSDWFGARVKSWNIVDDSTDQPVQSVAVGGSYTLTPAEYEAYPVALKYKANVTLLDEFKYNIYIEKTEEVSNFKINGVTPNTITLSDGEYYYVTSDPQKFNDLEGGFSVPVTYTVNYEGENYDLSTSVNVTLEGYISKGLTQYTHEDNPDDVELLVTFLSYLKACYGYNETTAPAWVNGFLNDHDPEAEDGCTCLATELPTTADDLTYANLTGCQVAYSPVLGTGTGVTRAALAVLVPTSSGDATVTATLKGIVNNKTNQTINVTFTKAGTSGEYDVYLSDTGSVAIYNMLETVTITVNGTSGTFNLGAYVVANNEVGLTNALYRFAKAAYDFKMVGATVATN